MREHALPQDVVGYKFHIIGNMTLKQFAEVAAGCVLGFILYQTNLPVIIKWPAILIVVGLGAFTAFIPFEERPFDHWLVAFFAALYRPTKFFWKRSSKIPDPFLYSSDPNRNANQNDIDLSPVRQQRAREFLHSITDSNIRGGETADTQEHARVQEIISLFTTTSVKIPTPTMTTPATQTHPTETLFLNQSLSPLQGTETKQEMPTPPTQKKEVVVQNIPENSPLHIVQNKQTQMAFSQSLLGQKQVYMQDQPQPSAYPSSTSQVVFNAQLPFPETPTEVNKVVGMVLDTQRKPLIDVVVEILAENGVVARAIKTNLLGQFFVNTPLAAGTYTLVAKKAGHVFSPQQLILTNTIVRPIEVQSVTQV